MSQLQPVILSGGSGTRLALSLEQYPKQLLAWWAKGDHA